MGTKKDHRHNHHAHGLNSANPFQLAVFANLGIVIVQLIFGFIANSTSLLADALHNLGDVLSLILAWIANSLLKRKPTEFTTYGMKKISIFAALVNGFLLVFTCGMIATHAIYQFFSPEPIRSLLVMVIAALGVIVNGSTALLFSKKKSDLNMKAAFMHLVADALISGAVVLAALIIYSTEWLWVDPLAAILIAFVILKGTWRLFKDSFRLMIDGVPSNISLVAVRSELEAVPGVKQVHDLHIWALSTRENAMSVHLWMPKKPLTDETRLALEEELKRKHNIHHTTIQVEFDLDYCEDSCKERLE